MSFRLPIQYLAKEELCVLPSTVCADLELVSPTDPSGRSMYSHLLLPSHEFGRKMIPEWSRQITTNTRFLLESQDVIRAHSDFLEKTKGCSSAVDCEQFTEIWKSLKSDPRFLDKYAYMEWNMLKHLNESPAFLQGMSVVHLLSPITTVLVPLLSLLVPFVLLKLKGVAIDLSTYVAVLKDIAKHNFVGKTILSIQNMTNANFIYVFMSIAFYCIQMYNNVVSFYKYYRNVLEVSKNIEYMRTYVETMIAKMDAFDALHREKSMYQAFCRETRMHRDVLMRLHKELSCVDPFSFKVSALCGIGYMMRCYYALHADLEYENSLSYSIGFEGYIDNLGGLHTHYTRGNIQQASFDVSGDTLITDEYYPAHIAVDVDKTAALDNTSTCVKNRCHLDKNMIITGVNASGKTTMLKTTSLNIIFTQQFGMGYYKTMNLRLPYTHIHSYLNIPDTSGRDSLFQAEARRCKEIIDCIHNSGSDARHFCIFDELYSGTNPIEASKSAYAFLVYLSKFVNVDFMLTTHYTTICKKCKATGRIRNYKMDVVRDENDAIVYTYCMKNGVCYMEGGVEILKSMDYPEEIIQTIQQYDIVDDKNANEGRRALPIDSACI